MKLKKLSMLLAACVLGAALLAGCSSDSESTTEAKTLDEMYDIICAANPISNPRDLTDMNITLDFMLSLDSIVEYKGVASNDGGDAGMVIIIEAAEGEADAIYAALESYATSQAAFWANYEEFADAKASVEDSLLVQDGNIIIQVFASNEADYTDIDTALSEAMG